MSRPPLPTGAAERAAIVDAMHESAAAHDRMAADSTARFTRHQHMAAALFLRSTAAQISRGEC